MRSTSFSRNHPYAKTRGWVSPTRAANALPTVSDGAGNEVDNASEILIIGGTVSEPEDGIAQISFGGLAQSSNTGSGPGGFPNAGSAGTPVYMRNTAGFALIPGDVVIVDETSDSAVTTTSTASNTKIAGVVQSPIGVGEYGPVLFNGFASIVNTTGTVARGDYALTSATAARAGATDTRVAGSFAVYLTGTDYPDFATSSATTEQDVPVNELDITMPEVIPAGRVLFLALWVETGITPTVDGWTRIGAEAGFFYYTKTTEGDDTATATFDDVTVAVATVLLLNANVSIASIVESHDYDTSTSAATVGSLSDVPRYAIAGVQAAVTPGSSYVRLGGGSAGFDSGGTLTIVQEATGSAAAGCTFGSAVTEGNLLISIMAGRDDDGVQMATSAGGSIDSSWTDLSLNQRLVTVGDTDLLSMQAKHAVSTSAGPFYTTNTPTSTGTRMYMFEVAGVGIADVEVLAAEDEQGSPIDLGSFATVGADDLVILAVIGKDVGGGTFNTGIAATGYTEDYDADVGAGSGDHPWVWVAHRSGSGGSVDAEFTHGGDLVAWHWAGIAVHFVTSAHAVAGTLAGKYIGHASSATSPFTGGGAQNDAVFAINLLQDAKASALLYGPDLGGSGSGAPTTVDYLVGTASGDLSGEIVVGTSPGGELGGTWASPTVDATHAGSTHSAAADTHIADTSDAHDASAISAADAGGYLVGTDVEAQLQELAAGARGWTDHGSAGATETISFITGHHRVVLSANLTVTFADAVSGDSYFALVDYVGDGTIRTVGYTGSTVTWVGDALSHPGTLNEVVSVIYRTTDGGTNVIAQVAGGGSSVAALDDLSDVTITSATLDDDLRYNGSAWVNDARKWEIVTDGEDVLVWDGDELVYEWSS